MVSSIIQKTKAKFISSFEKNFEIDKIRILLDVDLLLKIRFHKLIVWCLANNLREKLKILYVSIQIKRKYISDPTFSIAVTNCLIKKF